MSFGFITFYVFLEALNRMTEESLREARQDFSPCERMIVIEYIRNMLNIPIVTINTILIGM